MGRGMRGPGAAGGPGPAPPSFADMLDSMRTMHKYAAKEAFTAYKEAEGEAPHRFAADLARAAAHLDAASRYAAAAKRLALGMDANDNNALRLVYGRRISAVINSAASLSARSSKIMARLHRDYKAGNLGFSRHIGTAATMAEKGAAATRNAGMAVGKMFPARRASRRLAKKAAGKAAGRG